MTPRRSKRWFADSYRSAIWDSESLKPNERLVALVYADHARDGDVAWVTWDRLSQRTGIRSKTALSNATKGLVEAGWLKCVEKRRQHRSPRYQLLIPVGVEVRSVYVPDPDRPPEVADMDLWRERKAVANG